MIRQVAAEKAVWGLAPAYVKPPTADWVMIHEQTSTDPRSSIVTPLVQTLQNMQLPYDSDGSGYNPLTRGRELFRVMKLESVSTAQHASEEVRRSKSKVALGATSLFFRQSIQRQKVALETSDGPVNDASMGDIAMKQSILDDIKAGRGLAQCEWDMMFTWIVARKALQRRRDEPWMTDCFLKAH